MRQVLAALILSLSLSGCALFKPEAWAKQMFSPSSQSINTACDNGISSFSRREFPKFGRVYFSPKVGELGFHSQLGQMTLFCFLAGNFAKSQSSEIAQIFTSEVRLLDTTSKREAIKVQISLEREGQELIRLEPSVIEPQEEAGSTNYVFHRLSGNQITALEETTSFTVIVNRGSGEERYAVNPTNLPGL
jgi:hypothetical protein